MGIVLNMNGKQESNLVAMLAYKVIERGYSVEQIAGCLGIKEASWFRRKKEPALFRLAELEELSKRLGVVVTIENGITTAKERGVM